MFIKQPSITFTICFHITLPIQTTRVIQHVCKEQAPGFIRYQSRGTRTVVAPGDEESTNGGISRRRPSPCRLHCTPALPRRLRPRPYITSKKTSLSLTSINWNKCYRKCYRHFCHCYYVSSTEECWRPQNTAFVATLCSPHARGAVPTVGAPVSACLSPLYYMYAGTGTLRDWALPLRSQFQKTTLPL